MQIHQFVHTLNYGDAISGEAIAIKRILSEQSIESQIYSVHAHEKVASLVRDYKLFKQALEQALSRGEDVGVLLHYSIASPLNQLFSELSGFKKALVYHNLTPVKWFEAYNSRVTKDLCRGFDELPELLKDSDVVLADSNYNKQEIAAKSPVSVDVLPLFLDQTKWGVSSNKGIEGVLKSHGGKNILHVGRLAPNKRIEDVIKAFYFYHQKIEKNSKLWLIGTDVDTEIYSFELRRMVSELRLKEAVSFVGAVADSELKAFYQNSDLYLCMSEHEGFCVPLLEAMHFNLPVIAFDSTAVGETLGDGGLLIKNKLPAKTAELINFVLTDDSFRAKMQLAGQGRVKEFSQDIFSTNLESKLISRFRSIGVEKKKVHASG